MRINTNVASLTANRNLQVTQLAVANSMTKLSSGFRINRAGDDAAGLSIANNLRTTSRSLEMSSRNIEQANSMLQIAEGAGSSIESIVERMKELATQASTDTNASQRTTLNSEFQDLKSEIDRISNSTEFQGSKLIDGSFSGKTLQIGAGNTSNEQLGVSIGGLTAANLGLASADISSLASAQAALTQLDGSGTGSTNSTTALGEVNKTLSKIGSYQNRLGFAQDNVKTSMVNIAAAESTIRDVDMAQEMSRFSKNQILSQAGTSMLAQANQSAQNVLSLLR